MIREKIKNAEYCRFEQFETDLKLIFTNCQKYNGTETPYFKAAEALQSVAKPRVDRLRKQYEGVQE